MATFTVASAARRLLCVTSSNIGCQVVIRRLASFDTRSLAHERQELVTLRHMYDVCSAQPLSIAPWLHRQVGWCVFVIHVCSSRVLFVVPATFLHPTLVCSFQLPLRIARVMVLLLDAPASLASQLPLRRALDAYAYMQEQLVNMRVCTQASGRPSDAFVELIDRIYCVNHDAMRLVAQAVQLQQLQHSDCSSFLTEFFSHRVRLRTLCGQVSAVWNASKNSPSPHATDDASSDYSPKHTRCDSAWGDNGQIGALQQRTHVAGCLSDAAAAAGDVCRRTFGVAPDVEIVGDVAASLLYMPDHLFGIVFELLKNSMRAVCERHGDVGLTLPPIAVRVCDGAQDITNSVIDQGVGFSMASLPDLFRFYYSTSASRVNVGDDAVSMYHSGTRSNAMAGHGYGLPLARINVRSFGGDIILAPMQGFGCAAFVYLQKHSDTTF